MSLDEKGDFCRETLSVVVPCFNEEDALPVFIEALATVCWTLDDVCVELILIDDGSKDRTLSRMKEFAVNPSLPFKIHYLSLSRNFGKESALLAGLDAAEGDYVVTMDVDLQDPPELIPQMLSAIRTDGWDSVATCRVDRQGEPPIRSVFAHLFYRIISRMADIDVVDGARDYRMMTRGMVDSIRSLPEYNRFSTGIYGWVGFQTKWIPYENVERSAGETKWSFWKLFRYALEGIVAFSTAPLALASILGLILCVVAGGFAVFVVIRAACFGDPVAGWPSLMTVVLLIGGSQLLCLGIIGQYLAKAYLETKHRPKYIIRESGGEGKKDSKTFTR